MANIAEAAGMSRPAHYQYFRDKGDIFQSAFVVLFEELVEQTPSALHHPGSTAEQLDGFLQRYEGDLWQRMAASPHADEIVNAKDAEVVAAVATRLSDGLTAYLEQHSAHAQTQAGWVEVLRLSPKGFTYDGPPVETDGLDDARARADSSLSLEARMARELTSAPPLSPAPQALDPLSVLPVLVAKSRLGTTIDALTTELAEHTPLVLELAEPGAGQLRVH